MLDCVAPTSAERVTALIELGDLCRFRGHHEDAEVILVRALDEVVQPGLASEPLLKASALNTLGIEYKDTGRYDAHASPMPKPSTC